MICFGCLATLSGSPCSSVIETTLKGSSSNFDQTSSASNEEYQEWLEQKRLNQTKKKLKKKHGGNIPPWVDPQEHVEELADSQPIQVTVSQEYTKLCNDLSEDRKAFHPPTPEGQALFNRFKEEGWTTPRIKAACRLAYTSDSYWRENFTPTLFFRRTSSQSGESINNVEKYFNMRVGDDPSLIQIKQDAKKEEDELQNG